MTALSNPITDEEARVLREAVEKRCHLDLVIEWLEERHALPDTRWLAYADLKRRVASQRDRKT